jgi:hypothetical protein
LLKPCNNRKTPSLRDDPDWGIEKQMEGGAYHGVRIDIGGRLSQLAVGYLVPSKSYNYLPLVDLWLSLL